jgi:hypothetical protein
VLPHTKATFWTSVELYAPDNEKVNDWEINGDIPQSEYPHQIEPAILTFRTVAPAEHTITIHVATERDQLPLKGAYILLGMYRAESDQQGTAILKVPNGKHDLSITLMDYLPHEEEITVTGDMTVTAPLIFSPFA